MAALSSELFCPLATRRRYHVSTPSRNLQKSDDSSGEEQQSADTGGGSTADGGRLGRLRGAGGDGSHRRKRSVGLDCHSGGGGAVKAGPGAGEASTGGARNSGGLFVSFGHDSGVVSRSGRGGSGSRRSSSGGRSRSGAGGFGSSSGGDRSRACG